MIDSAFLKFEFFALIATSIVIPAIVFWYLISRTRIHRYTALYFGLFLLLLGGIDVVLLRRLQVISKQTPSLFDDAVFASEISIGLYLLPVIAIGIGVNLISHVLVDHLRQIEDSRG